MMDSLPEAHPLLVGELSVENNDAYAIYTHSVRSRYLVLAMLGTYLILFTFFTDFARDKILELNQLPDAFVVSGDFAWTRWSTYLISGLGWFAALAFLIYFLFAVIDIWGLQVWVNSQEIRVQNTIVGQRLARWTGVGRMAMDEIAEIHPKAMVTYLYSGTKRIQFSPVDQLESLISTLLQHARHAKIME